MKNVIIVGGSRGIGAATLNRLLPNNRVFNLSRTAPSVSHPNLEHHTVDVLEDDLPDLDSADVLVYCPGSINLKPITMLKESDFEADFRINLMGAVRAVKKYLPLLKKSEKASILFFSTVAVKMGMPFHASVASAKGAIEGLTRSLAAELAPNIRVNCIAPTLTDTDLAKNILRSEKARTRLAEKNPLKKIMQADDIAACAEYLIDGERFAINGQVIHVDGALSSIQT